MTRLFGLLQFQETSTMFFIISCLLMTSLVAAYSFITRPKESMDPEEAKRLFAGHIAAHLKMIENTKIDHFTAEPGGVIHYNGEPPEIIMGRAPRTSDVCRSCGAPTNPGRYDCAYCGRAA